MTAVQTETARQAIEVWFDHGLGDCVHFAHLLEVYRRRGYAAKVHYERNKQFVWDCVGAEYSSTQPTYHSWEYPSTFNSLEGGEQWFGSKIFHNLAHPVTPPIMPRERLWDELCSVEIDAEARLPRSGKAHVAHWLAGLPRPITLLHSHGSNFADRKNLPDDVCRAFYRSYLGEFDGSLVLLDWDLRIPTLRHQRVRHVQRDFGHISLEHLGALYAKSDLLIGIDSGPFHFAKMFRVPTIGVWLHHVPSQCTLPNRHAVNLVRRDPHQPTKWASRRSFWNLVEYDAEDVGAGELMAAARAFLTRKRPLGERGTPARNAYFLGLLNLAGTCSGHEEYRDRHKTFEWLFREASSRFEAPVIVETGCVRSPEDWSAGYFTYLAAAYLEARGAGTLHTVDRDPARLHFARQTVGGFDADVRFHHCSSEAWLASPDAPPSIDVLYLDSMDTEEPRHAEHCLAEFLAAEPRLSDRAVVAIDDTTWNNGLVGKGRLAVPEMIRRGWKVRASGYQSVLTKA